MNILSIPCTNYFPNRLGLSPKYIILHGTAGGLSAVNIANYFVETQGTANPVASNFVIDQAGTIVMCVDPKHGAWANGALTAGHDNFWDPNINPNNLTISIEHVKSALDNSNSLTEAQQAASFWLVNKLCTDWNIPRHLANAAGGITGHYSIDPVNRQNCPGPYPTDALIRSLNPPISIPSSPQKEITVHMKQAFIDCWKSTNSGTDADFNSGIAIAWQQEAAAGRQYGPPLTHEYHSVDWNGAPIIVREFPGARCEWRVSNGATWIKR